MAMMLALACGSGDPAGPAAVSVSLIAADGDGQFAGPGQIAELPLVVRAIDATRGTGVKDVVISWTVTPGNGAGITATSTRTNGAGFASAPARVGSVLGDYRFEASAPRLVGGPASFTIHAVPTPTIASVAPLPAQAGATVTVTGTNFSAVAGENSVLFGGFRGTVRSASATQLVVDVPECVSTHPTELRVALGAVVSAPAAIQTAAASVSPLTLAVGKAMRFTQPGDIDCIRFAGVPAGARYLVVPQNAAAKFGVAMRYELTADATGLVTAPAWQERTAGHVDPATRFESQLRLRERAFGPVTEPGSEANAESRQTVIPAVGDRQEFNVLTKDGKTTKATGSVRLISQRAIIFVDVSAPAGGLTDTDLAGFANLFDDPIYTTDTAVFGQPSDIDGNQRIIIFFTGAVNALSERTDAGFIAGYFYGCDLVEKSRCSATNRGEIFYSLLPDPSGQYSAPRSKDVILHTVPAVLAHEFQHMINFFRKGERLDVLWLSEALAHSAEDIVGDVFAARGEMQTANDFRRPNYIRAQFFLQEADATTLLAEESPGTLEQRGASWLLLKYAMMQYGGTTLAGNLTASSATGADNLSGATGRPWNELLSDFAVAIWADRAPQLAGVSIDPRYTFGTFDLRAAIAGSGTYPLTPAIVPFQNFMASDVLASGAAAHMMFEAPSAQAGLNFAFTGKRGGPFATGSPQLTVLRVR